METATRVSVDRSKPRMAQQARSRAVDSPYVRRVRQDVDALRMLADNWDNEGAPRPSDDALERAQAVLRWVEEARLDSFNVTVEPDVLGGVGVMVRSRNDRGVWVACMNNGRDTVVFEDGSRITATPWTAASKTAVVALLAGGSYQ